MRESAPRCEAMEWPCRVNVSRVLEEGEPLALEEVVESPGLSLPLGFLPEGRAISFRLVLDGVEEGVRAEGELEAEADLVCSRCLTKFRANLQRRVEEIFSVGGGEEAYRVEAGGWIELGSLLRDHLLEAMPFSPRCREECKGLCPSCGKDLNIGPCSCEEPAVDPRWRPLGRLLDELGS